MKKLMKILFLSCRKATELIEKRMHFNLSFSEQVQLKMHKAMCDACTNYEKQSAVIENAIEKSSSQGNQIADLHILKGSILSKIDKTK